MNTEEIIKSWAWRIKRIGITQSEFSEKAGISHSNFSQIINGKRSPRVDTFNHIEDTIKLFEVKSG